MNEPTFRYWWTREEYSHDKSTGAYALIKSNGFDSWKWIVGHKDTGRIKEGTSTTQKGARAACRRAIRKWENQK
jgi:hypothetical protein